MSKIQNKQKKLCKCTFYQLVDYGFPSNSLKGHAVNCPLHYCVYSKITEAVKVCSNCGVGLCNSCGYYVDSINLCNKCYAKITKK